MALLRSQNVWRAQLDWAASAINGHQLRQVLEWQVIDAESRSLEPQDFVQALTQALGLKRRGHI